MKGKTKESGRFDKDKFKYNAETDEFTCPNGEPVKFSFDYNTLINKRVSRCGFIEA
jgi:transcription initiation factor IIE alpha subunit